MMKPGIRLLLFFLVLSLQLTAQQYVITGYVVNPQKLPVSKALIQLDNASTSTNSKGFFTLRTDVLPNVLTVKVMRYETKEEFVNMPPAGTDSVFVMIQLDDKHTDLEGVTITASRVFWAYPKKHVHVIDFELQQDGMFLLCKDKNDYLLRLVDGSGEPLYDLPIRRHPKSFFRDCRGNIHLLYNDSTYQVQITKDSTLALCRFQTLDQFKETVMPCALTVNNAEVFQYGGNQSQSVDFVMIDTLRHKVTRLYSGKNRKYQRAITESERDLALLEKSRKDANTENAQSQLERQRAIEQQAALRAFLAKPVYIPVHKLRDSIVIFDHENDSAVVFSRGGRKIRSYPIIYQHHIKWDRELILNEEGTRIFARYNYRGMAHLVEIDPNTGAIIGETKLEQHIYPTKIQVKGDFIYYIYHHYIDYSINYVYKQRIQH
jgi:hypothetical protein